jgi:hypothetical protein
MTAVAVSRTKTGTTLVVDAIVLTADGQSGARSGALRDKIQNFGQGDLYGTVVGDELVLHALSHLYQWTKKLGTPFSVADPEGVEWLIQAATKLRRAAKNCHPNLPTDKGTTLYVCSRTRADIIQLEKTNTGLVHRSTQGVPEGFRHINYGGVVRLEKLRTEGEGDSGVLINKIEETHKANKSGPHALPYDFEGKFSWVHLPTDASLHVQEQGPFIEFTDLLAGPMGGQKNWDLMEDPNFRWSPKAK